MYAIAGFSRVVSGSIGNIYDRSDIQLSGGLDNQLASRNGDDIGTVNYLNDNISINSSPNNGLGGGMQFEGECEICGKLVKLKPENAGESENPFARLYYCIEHENV